MRRIALFLVLVSSCTSTQPMTPADTQAALAHELEAMALTANAASLIRAGKTDVALRLLEDRLASSVTEADRYAGGGARLPADLPNLRAAPGRASKYAADNGLPELAAAASRLAKQLQ